MWVIRVQVKMENNVMFPSSHPSSGQPHSESYTGDRDIRINFIWHLLCVNTWSCLPDSLRNRCLHDDCPAHEETMKEWWVPTWTKPSALGMMAGSSGCRLKGRNPMRSVIHFYQELIKTLCLSLGFSWLGGILFLRWTFSSLEYMC